MDTDLLNKLPPHNLDAEKGVIASMLLDAAQRDLVDQMLRPEHFYADSHQKLFKHITAMDDTGVPSDIILLTNRLTKAGDLEACGGPAYLAEVLGSLVVVAHAKQYADIVLEKAQLRELIHLATDILVTAYADEGPAVSLWERVACRLMSIIKVFPTERK